jgi:hypothetical protein
MASTSLEILYRSLLWFLMHAGLLFTHRRRPSWSTATAEGSSPVHWQNTATSSLPIGLNLVPLHNKTRIKYFPFCFSCDWFTIIPFHPLCLQELNGSNSFERYCRITRTSNKKAETHIQ